MATTPDMIDGTPVDFISAEEAAQQWRIDEAGKIYRQQLEAVHRADGRVDDQPGHTEENLLTPEELERLWAAEDEIRHGMAAYLRVAEALHTIQSERLYREDYSTFAAYCREKWNLTDRHARNMANAWEIALDIDSDPLGNAEQLPANERQARELKPVPRERRAEVWEAAVAAAGGVQHVCAHDVKAARQKLIDGPAEREAREAERLAQPEPAPQVEVREMRDVTVHETDPRNHAHRIINKYGTEYALELMEEISMVLALKEERPQ